MTSTWLETVRVARQHPHWDTVASAAAWLTCAQEAVADLADATHTTPAAIVTRLGLQPATVLFDAATGTFGAVPSMPGRE